MTNRKIIKLCLAPAIVAPFLLSFCSCSQTPAENKKIYIDDEAKTQYTSSSRVNFSFKCSDLELAQNLQCKKINDSRNVGNLSINAIHISGLTYMVELQFETLPIYSTINTFSLVFSSTDDSFTTTISNLKVVFNDIIHIPAIVFPSKEKLTSTADSTINGDLDVVFHDFVFEHFNPDWYQQVNVSSTFNFFGDDQVSCNIENVKENGSFDIRIKTTGVLYQQQLITGHLNFEWQGKSMKKVNDDLCTISIGSLATKWKAIPANLLHIESNTASKGWSQDSDIESFDTLAFANDSSTTISTIAENGFDGALPSTSSIRLIDFSQAPTLTEIKQNAFRNCISINFGINFNNNTHIFDNAFEGCLNLPYLTIRNAEHSFIFEKEAFKNTGLKRIQLSSTTSINGKNVFANCSKLKVVDVSLFDNVPFWLQNENDIFANCPEGGIVYINDIAKIENWKQCFEKNGLINWSYIPIENNNNMI